MRRVWRDGAGGSGGEFVACALLCALTAWTPAAHAQSPADQTTAPATSVRETRAAPSTSPDATSKAQQSNPVIVHVDARCGADAARARLIKELRLRVEHLQLVDDPARDAASTTRTPWQVRWVTRADDACALVLEDERGEVATLPLPAESDAAAIGRAVVRAAWFMTTVAPRTAPKPPKSPAPAEPFTAAEELPQEPEPPAAVAASTSAEQTSRRGARKLDTTRKVVAKKNPRRKPRGFWNGLGMRVDGWLDGTTTTTRKWVEESSRVANELQRSGPPPKKKQEGDLGLNLSVMSFVRDGSGSPMWFTGFRLGGTVDRQFGIGVVYQNLISSHRVKWDGLTDEDKNPKLSMNMAGIDLEYIAFPESRVYAVFNVMAGAGVVEYESAAIEQSERYAGVLVVDTSAQVMVKVNTWFEIGAGFGYRDAAVYPERALKRGDLSGFAGQLTLRLALVD